MNKKTTLIRYTELARQFGVSKSTIWRWRRDGSFPCHIALGPRAIGWRESDIEAWLISKTSIRSGKTHYGNS